MFSKISISIVISSLLLTFCFITPALARIAIIEVDNLNVRQGPGTEHKRIDQVHSGEKYDILKENEDWIKIQLSNATGWVTKEFTSIQSEIETLNEQTKEEQLDLPETITIQHNHTHIRDGPSTDHQIINFVEKGNVFDVLSVTGNWLEISDGEISGFIFKDFIEPFEQRNGNNNLRNKTIVIDAGHGGRDVGAIGINGSYERDITYLTSYKLKNELISLGANVILARVNNNEFIPLESRTTLANTVDTDIFLSLHYNSFSGGASVSGIETFYYHNQHRSLASYIHNEIIKQTGENNRGVSFADLHVIRQTFKPGALLELGFLSNEETEALLQNTSYQKKVVSGIVNGLQIYFSN